MSSIQQNSTSNVPTNPTGSVATTVTIRHYESNNGDNGDEGAEEVSRAETIYRSSGNSKALLYLLSIGLKDQDNLPLMDISTAPWVDIKPKSNVKPQLQDIRKEVIRRSSLFSIKPSPRPNGWTADRTVSWLKEHPLNNQCDVLFLEREVKRVYEIVMGAQKEAIEEEERLQQVSAWRDRVPYLRMIHCILEDDVKVAYLKRNDVPSRTQWDARNSLEKRASSAYELIADKWNCPQFNPVTEIMDCHEDFIAPIDCSYILVKDLAPATPQKIKDKITEMQTNLIRIIDNWEKSGQGDGGEGDEDEEDRVVLEYGALKNRSRKALDSRSSFLQNRPSYLLYDLWEIFEKHDLLKTTVNRLSEEVGAADGGVGVVPLVCSSDSHKKRKKTGNRTGTPESFASVSSSVASFSDTHEVAFSVGTASQDGGLGFSHSIRNLQRTINKDRLEDRIDHLEDEIRRYRMMEFQAIQSGGSSELATFLAHEIKSLESELDKKKSMLKRLDDDDDLDDD